MDTEINLLNLKQELEAAKAATGTAYSNMVEHREGGNSADTITGELLQHRYLAADALEMDAARRVNDAEELLDAQQQGNSNGH